LRSDQVPVGELAAVVGAALRRPRDVARLRLHLASHGVAVDVPVVLARDVPAADTITVTPATNEAARAERRVRVRTLWLVLGTLAVFGVVALLSPGRSPVHPIGGTRIPYPGLQSDHRFPPPYPTYTLYPTYTGYPLPTGYPGLPLPGIDPTSIIGPPHLDLTGTIVLRRGDTLALLACRYHTTVAELRRLNDLGGSTRLIAGAPFRVPLVFATGGTCR
jgi:hypothetical protein